MHSANQIAAGLVARLMGEEKAAAASKRVMMERTGQREWEFRGAALLIQSVEDPEVLVCGPAGTGKSLGILARIHQLLWLYPGMRVLFVRKVRADLAKSALVTFERHILGEDNPICSNVQREYRQVYHYPNGSEIVIGGMDRPTAVMSSEYDLIYVQEAIELNVTDWESLSTRLRSGSVPYQLLIGDTNPGSPDHWLKQRCDTGVTRLLNSYHEDNPAYWDGEQWTKQGAAYIARLEALTGVRKERLRFGRWAAAEGVIFEDWDDTLHVIDSFPIPRSWKRFISIDFGFTNPMVVGWWAIDPDGRLYRYREIYRTRMLVEDVARRAKKLTGDERIGYVVCDHDAEGRATWERHFGMKTIPAKKAISTGIQAMQARMRVAGDGKPRLFFFRDGLVEMDVDLEERRLPTSTIAEIPGYVWADRKRKEEPVDEDNHGVDMSRYAIMSVDSPQKKSSGRATVRGLYG